MSKNYAMAVHLFKVIPLDGVVPLEDLLQQIHSDVLAARTRAVSSYHVRMEYIDPPGTATNSTRFWKLDFTKLRFENGPGKVSVAAPITGFSLANDEGFGEETAAFYDPKNAFLIVQYNHSGVRAPGIAEYFGNYGLDPSAARGYALRVKLDETSDVKLANKQVLTKLNFKVAAGEISAAYKASNVGLSRALDFTENYLGNDLEITIAAPRGGHLHFSRTTALIDKLKALATDAVAHDKRIVKKFQISGKTDDHGRAEAIDMLSPKLESSVDQLVLGADRRLERNSRMDGLLRVCNGWSRFLP